MKIQHLSVIFIIIIVPISLVLSEYLHVHIKTIEAQTQYTTNLINATYDAAEAFRLNTANNAYYNLGNSKERDIQASINTFYNTLGTSMGSSGYTSADLYDYTPAILCTLYDGYYIYTKYYDTELNTTGDYTYGLKPFVNYSCRYKANKYDFVVNYTLDNTITIIGTVDGQYVTRTGHLINKETEEKLKNEMDDNEKLTETLITLDNSSNQVKSIYEYVVYNNQKVYGDHNTDNKLNGKYFYYSTDCTKDYVTTVSDVNAIAKIFNDGNGGSDSAKNYYVDASTFTNWVNEYLGDITAKNAVDSDGNPITDFATDLGESHIFETNNDNDPLLSSSAFNEHRMNVIRKSIETNLVPAIANYNVNSTKGYEFAMPKIQEDKWYKIENNVCFVSFLQGLPITSKTYNNYCVVANNTNLETVGEDSIYIKTEKDNQIEYHRPGCKKLITDINKNSVQIIGAYAASDFKRKSVELTGEDANAAKQRNEWGEEGANSNTAFFFPQEGTACYDCIVNIADTYSTDDIIKGTIEIKNADGTVTETITVPPELRKVYLQALARCRYDLYTVNGYFGVN